MKEIFDLNIEYLLEVVLRITLAVIVGAFFGYQRQKKRKSAGIKTHMLVCVASALVMLTGEFIFDKYSDAGLDPARLAAQVISGVGFIGAGAIIKEGMSIKGLTTAAGVWATACLGIACGAGFYAAVLFVTIIVTVVQIIAVKVETRMYLKQLKKVKKTMDIDNTDLDDMD